MNTLFTPARLIARLAAAGLASAGLAAAGLAAGPAAAQDAAAAPASSKVGVPLTVGKNRFQGPETVLWDDQANVYLVSNVNGPFTKKDGNGFISRVAPDGKIIELRWIDGKNPSVHLDAPKGMIFVGDELWVCDLGAVRVFDRKTGKPKGEHTTPGSYMLNYLSRAADGTVYVTDTGAKQGHAGAIYAIKGSGPGKVLVKGAYLDRPDGVLAENQGLLVTPYGAKANTVYRLSLAGKRTPYAKMPAPQLDGLLRLPDGSLVVTSWMGQAVYRVQGGKPSVLLQGIESPAQIGYDAKRHQLLVPSYKGNYILLAPLTAGAHP